MNAYLFIESIASDRTKDLIRRVVRFYDNNEVSPNVNLLVTKLDAVADRNVLIDNSINKLPCINYAGINLYSVEEIMVVIKTGTLPKNEGMTYSDRLKNIFETQIQEQGEIGTSLKQINEEHDDEAMMRQRDKRLEAQRKKDEERTKMSQLGAMKRGLFENKPSPPLIQQPSVYTQPSTVSIKAPVDQGNSYDDMLRKAMLED